jgi:hypothetical protein
MLKQIAFAATLLSTVSAFAGEAKLIGSFSIEAEKKCLSGRPEIKYGLNNVKDTATVEVSFEDRCSATDSESGPSEFSDKVANPAVLSLDAQEGVATLGGKGGIECAYTGSFLGHDYIKSTGDCKISLGYKEFSKSYRLRNSDVVKKNYTEVSVYIQAK